MHNPTSQPASRRQPRRTTARRSDAAARRPPPNWASSAPAPAPPIPVRQPGYAPSSGGECASSATPVKEVWQRHASGSSHEAFAAACAAASHREAGRTERQRATSSPAGRGVLVQDLPAALPSRCRLGPPVVMCRAQPGRPTRPLVTADIAPSRRDDAAAASTTAASSLAGDGRATAAADYSSTPSAAMTIALLLCSTMRNAAGRYAELMC